MGARTLAYPGTITYINTPAQCEAAVDRFLQRIESSPPHTRVLGFDAEWHVTYKPGAPPRCIALLQLASHTECLLVHVMYTGITSRLRALLRRTDIIKAGVAAPRDADLLAQQYSVTVGGVIDVNSMHAEGVTSLQDLAYRVCRVYVPKPRAVRTSNWETRPLSPAQCTYAVTDAYAGLVLYDALLPRLRRSALPLTITIRPEPLVSAVVESAIDPCTPTVAGMSALQARMFCMHLEGETIEAIAAATSSVSFSVIEALCAGVVCGHGYVIDERLGLAVAVYERMRHIVNIERDDDGDGGGGDGDAGLNNNPMHGVDVDARQFWTRYRHEHVDDAIAQYSLPELMLLHAHINRTGGG